MSALGTVEDSIARGIYRDRGCHVAPKCLDCPRAQCVYEMLERVTTVAERDTRIVELRKEGVPVAELARAFNLSTRAIHRVLERGGPSQAALTFDRRYGPDEPGKPVTEIRSAYKQRRPWPQLRRAV